ncbi:LLM class flavin-dependent oxidoreductase [Iodidimonas sp. SYSU 1G8]|uniref:LLM class flavin-dependent oxidoreductase n=1 Tax=Iodidimonas sp. SYSU 1G8 TaxID=3133967 RepID=UPI0031FF0D27
MSPLKLSVIITSQDWATPHLEEIDATALHGLYVADHPSFPVTESWTWLAYAAARTRRIRLGTHVTGAPFYHPTRLAKQVASVDALSNGRAVLGIGTAYEVQDFMPYGFPMAGFRDRVEYLEESLVIIKQLFTGRIDGFRGRFHTYEGEADFAPVPVNGSVPIWIGLNKAGLALQVAARHADAINTWQLSPDQVREIAGPLAEAVEKAGRTAGDVAITCDVVMARGADTKGAEDLAHRIRDMARGWGRKDSVTDWGVGGVLHGDGDAMLEQLQRFADAGCSEVTVSASSIEDVRWVDENVARRLA